MHIPQFHIGVDEAGRGCLAGPVTAAAVLFPPGFDPQSALPGLTDSKKLSEARRDALAPAIRGHALAWGVGLAWPEEIDTANILNATFRAMSRAVAALAARGGFLHGSARPEAERKNAPPAADSGTTSGPCENDPPAPAAGPADSLPPLVIDGNHVIPELEWRSAFPPPPRPFFVPFFAASVAVEKRPPILPGRRPPISPAPFFLAACPPRPRPASQFAVVDGDALCPAVSAASILAKTWRDALMVRLDTLFPGYGFAGHKGYGVERHLAALASLGPCRLHRKTFRRVRPEQEQFRLL